MNLYKKLRSAVGKLALSAGIDMRLRTPDRRELETVILPWFIAAPAFPRVLFIGCDWYTHGYTRLFAGKEYHTIDFDPKKAFFGSPRHVVDSATNLTAHYAEGYFDVVFFNGIYGYGINEREPLDQCMTGMHHVLKQGGVMVVGWDDVPERSPFPLYELRSLALFERWTFPPYGASQRKISGDYGKIYDFFAKPAEQTRA